MANDIERANFTCSRCGMVVQMAVAMAPVWCGACVYWPFAMKSEAAALPARHEGVRGD